MPSIILYLEIENRKGLCYHGTNKKRANSGWTAKELSKRASAKASTVCYGYKFSHTGELVINPTEANIVLFIFHHFMNGDSLGKISDALARMGIVSSTGRTKWNRETISKLLANEKYIGNVVLGKTTVIDGVQIKSHDTSKRVLMRAHHPAIISHELFNAVQWEKFKRSRSRIIPMNSYIASLSFSHIYVKKFPTKQLSTSYLSAYRLLATLAV